MVQTATRLITSSDSDCFYANNTNNYFRANTIGRTTITYTHKDFKDVSFSIEVTSKLHPADYIVDNLGFVYINESKKITIPDEYIPLSDFTTIERADWIEDGDTIADFKVEREGNTLFLQALARENDRCYSITSIVRVDLSVPESPSPRNRQLRLRSTCRNRALTKSMAILMRSISGMML